MHDKKIKIRHLILVIVISGDCEKLVVTIV